MAAPDPSQLVRLPWLLYKFAKNGSIIHGLELSDAAENQNNGDYGLYGGSPSTAPIPPLTLQWALNILLGRYTTYGTIQGADGRAPECLNVIGAANARLTGVPYTFFVPTSPAPGTLLLSDSFTDTPGITLDQHTPDIGAITSGWILTDGTVSIDGTGTMATGVSLGTSGAAQAVGDDGWADVLISAQMTHNTGGTNNPYGIVFRYKDNNNYWFFRVNRSNSKIELLRKNGGNSVVVANASFTSTPGVPNLGTVRAVGPNVTCMTDTGASFTYGPDTANNTATQHGLRTNNAGTDTFDQFSVQVAA
jgi:hypothetical protein